MPVTNIQGSTTEQNNSGTISGNTGNGQTTNPGNSGTTQTQTTSGTQGLSTAELNDPNSIKVDVADKKAPLVILFGPPACGKTMTLVRMTRFLNSEGYTVKPIRTFRPSFDTNYKEMCDRFDETMNSNKAADATSRISFMLVEVLDHNKRRICQILEAPGEYYFNPEKPSAQFPNFVNTIIGNSNRKIWTIIVEPDWRDMPDRANYVTKISNLKRSMRAKDSTVFLFNKIDLTPYVRSIGDINTPAAIREVQNLYPNIFVPFKNQNPVTKLWREFNCDFVPFQTGYYTEAANSITYQEGPREYCVKLWSCIMKKITG